MNDPIEELQSSPQGQINSNGIRIEALEREKSSALLRQRVELMAHAIVMSPLKNEFSSLGVAKTAVAIIRRIDEELECER